MDDPPPPHPAEPLKIETPVIRIQDLERNPGPQTRVSNKGVRVQPRIDSADARDLAREDEKALQAMEAFEKSIREQAPS
jgi:hypothetical protein